MGGEVRGREREGGEGGRRRKGEDGTTIVRSDKTSDYHYVFLLNLKIQTVHLLFNCNRKRN